MAKKAPKKKSAGSSKSAAKSAPKKAAPARVKPKAEKPKADKSKAAKATAKAAPAKAPKTAPAKAPKAAPAAPAAPAEAAKPARKGITIVSQKPVKKAKAPSPASSFVPPGLGRLLDPKNPVRKPLIPSGPKAAAQRPLGQHGGVEDAPPTMAKSPFGKKDLERFRTMLLRKRAELVGDVSTMENEALRGESGSLSNMPSHMAEQGSEAYDQALSLDLAAADRKLIREIDDAIKRIDEGTFGVCELTGKPIKLERLEELPWARYSIEAARELERQSMRA